MNPNDSKHISRLRKAMEYSRRKLKPFRDNRLEAIKEFVGSHYSDNGSQDRVPVNMIELAINVYLANLVSKEPQVMASTVYPALKVQAADYELALNHHLRQMKLVRSLRQVALDAMFGLGIMKTGLEITGGVEFDNILHDIGKPFAEAVDLDDWVHDASATVYERVSFAGDRYRLPLEAVKGAKFYERDVTAGLQATRKGDSQQEAGEAGEKAEGITKGQDSDPDEYEDMVELWDIWLPRDGLVITIPADGPDRVLRVVEWEGPETGPYRTLSYEDVPSNIMPLPPVALWRDLHELSNRVFRKLGRQADRQKTILGVRSGKEDDGAKIVGANDGEAVSLNNPGDSQEYKFGGVDAAMLAFFMQTEGLFSKYAGNLDALGGLGVQAPTMGQEELIATSASKRMQTLQGRLHEFAVGVVKDQGWYLWHDPFIQMPLTKRIPGTELEVPTTFDADAKEGNFEDYNIDIQVHSMVDQTPQQRMSMLMQIFTTILVPLAPQLQAQGKTIDMGAFLEKLAKYSNLPDLGDIVIDAGPQMEMSSSPVGQAPQKSPVTQRTNVRVSRSVANRAGQTGAMTQQLMAMAGQQQQTGLQAGGM